MVDKLKELRERYGRQHLPRFFSKEADDEHDEIRGRDLGTWIAIGAGVGLAAGAGFGIAFSSLASGIGFGICLGIGLGIAVGSSQGGKNANAEQQRSDAEGGRDD